MCDFKSGIRFPFCFRFNAGKKIFFILQSEKDFRKILFGIWTFYCFRWVNTKIDCLHSSCLKRLKFQWIGARLFTRSLLPNMMGNRKLDEAFAISWWVYFQQGHWKDLWRSCPLVLVKGSSNPNKDKNSFCLWFHLRPNSLSAFILIFWTSRNLLFDIFWSWNIFIYY